MLRNEPMVRRPVQLPQFTWILVSSLTVLSLAFDFEFWIRPRVRRQSQGGISSVQPPPPFWYSVIMYL